MTFVADAEPYPWPYDGDLRGSHLALVVAGWDDEWSRRSTDPIAVVELVDDLARAVLHHEGLVVTVAHRRADPLAPPSGAVAITADGLDGFHGGPLDGHLRRSGRTHLLIAGHGLEGPVHSTMRSANDRGYECLLVADACAPLSRELVAASLKQIHMSGGIFGATGTSASVLEALHPVPTVPVPEATA